MRIYEGDTVLLKEDVEGFGIRGDIFKVKFVDSDKHLIEAINGEGKSGGLRSENHFKKIIDNPETVTITLERYNMLYDTYKELQKRIFHESFKREMERKMREN